jgi:hypothetical protein
MKVKRFSSSNVRTIQTQTLSAHPLCTLLGLWRLRSISDPARCFRNRYSPSNAAVQGCARTPTRTPDEL